MKKVSLAIITIISLGLFQCQKTDKSFIIAQDQVGTLKKGTPVTELETLYSEDSLVMDNSSSLLSPNKKIEVFEKGGIHLLTLTSSADSVPVVENIRIRDPRFLTDKGIGLNSTFKEVNEKHSIRKIVTSMNNVVLFLKENDMYITIDKQELPSSLRYASSTNIEAVQIPDAAKIKYLMVGWE
ncbi:MAG: hypothetical protein V7724_00605 [Sediminicola sp.]|tara:strand:- start:156044 stop:156592 length:549 start_codon:yes stop_codon:yes gene_type:complete